MKYIQLATLLVSLFIHGISNAKNEYLNYSGGAIAGNAVMPPPNTFLLIRKQDKICAIKFTEWQRGNDATESTTFHSGEESFRAKYVWYLGEKKGDNWIINPSIEHGESEVTQKHLVGVGRLAFGGGNYKINCGAFKLQWSSPAFVYFYETQKKNKNYDVEIALTNWHTYEDISLDENLEWLKYDESRPYTKLPNQ